MDLRKNRGNSPFSASANSMREPVSTPPRLLPVIETTEPALMSNAPAAPMNSNEASASGVFDAARLGSVPIATICASVMMAVTAMIVATKANGTCRRGSVASPAGTPITS